MIALNRRTKIFVCKKPIDMRASYDTLFAKTKGMLRRDPYSGHLFVFINLKRTSCKCLYYDTTGFVIIAKRLENGQFSKVNQSYKKEIVLTESEFGMYFEGADLQKRFIESPFSIRKKVRKQSLSTCKQSRSVKSLSDGSSG